jgi:hypothetical protein
MLREIHGTNFFHIKFLSRRTSTAPSTDFYFDGQALY